MQYEREVCPVLTIAVAEVDILHVNGVRSGLCGDVVDVVHPEPKRETLRVDTRKTSGSRFGLELKRFCTHLVGSTGSTTREKRTVE